MFYEYKTVWKMDMSDFSFLSRLAYKLFFWYKIVNLRKVNSSSTKPSTTAAQDSGENEDEPTFRPMHFPQTFLDQLAEQVLFHTVASRNKQFESLDDALSSLFNSLEKPQQACFQTDCWKNFIVRLLLLIILFLVQRVTKITVQINFLIKYCLKTIFRLFPLFA